MKEFAPRRGDDRACPQAVRRAGPRGLPMGTVSPKRCVSTSLRKVNRQPVDKRITAKMERKLNWRTQRNS